MANAVLQRIGGQGNGGYYIRDCAAEERFPGQDKIACKNLTRPEGIVRLAQGGW
jgi:hypothetical protein